MQKYRHQHFMHAEQNYNFFTSERVFDFSFCIGKLAINLHMIKETYPKIEFLDIFQYPLK